MTTFRITYREKGISREIAEYLGNSKLVATERTLVSPGRMEVRSSEGDVFRLQKDTEFVVRETEEGMQPVVSGEVFGVISASWMKYKTSCYSCKSHSSAPLQLLIRPSLEYNDTDEYLLLMGDMVVHDFDENGRHFVICTLEEGDKAFIRYDSNFKVGRNRYNAQIERMSDEDWSYVQSEYLNSRRWID